MRISIITACYNSKNTIEQTINSVLNQNYHDIEYIVIDGGSNDGTLEIIKKYESKLKYISEKDNGIYDAINKGLKLATGDVIGIIGADDFYPTNNIYKSVMDNFLQKNVDALYGDMQFVNAQDSTKIERLWIAGEYQKQNWLEGWMPPHLTFYLRKSMYDKYGYYLTNFTCSGDYELMLRMLYVHNCKVAYLPKLLVTMRNGGTSNASLKHRIVANLEDRNAWKINQVTPKWYTLWKKPLSKITQLFANK